MCMCISAVVDSELVNSIFYYGVVSDSVCEVSIFDSSIKQHLSDFSWSVNFRHSSLASQSTSCDVVANATVAQTRPDEMPKTDNFRMS